MAWWACTYNPRHGGVGAVKAEENNVQKAKVYTALALEHDGSLQHAAFTTKMLLDTELVLMHAFDCHLLVFSAHTELGLLLADIKEHHAALRKVVFEERVDQQGQPLLSRTAWSVTCDAHCSSACLSEPPACVALASLILAAKLEQVPLVCCYSCLLLRNCPLRLHSIATGIMQNSCGHGVVVGSETRSKVNDVTVSRL